MNACIISYSFYDIDYRVRRYAEALTECGHKVDVIALCRPGDDKKESVRGVTVHRIQKRVVDEKNKYEYLLKILSFFIKGTVLLSFKFIRSRYRIIHIHNFPDFLIFMALLPKIFGAKLILDIHDILPEFFAQKFNLPIDSLETRFLFLVEKASVRFAHHVIAANDIWREKIILRDKIPSETCTTMLNYPNMAFFLNGDGREQPGDGELRIVYPGTISHLHGLDILIRALSIVKTEIPQVRLDIYTRLNKSSYYQELELLMVELEVADNITIHNEIPIEELVKVYRHYNMGVVPKRGGVFSSEAFSTKMFDFMAVGLPIVASRTKIDDYYFDDSILAFFEPEDYQGLAKKIIEVYTTPALRSGMIEKGLKYVKMNNWQQKKLEYLNLVNTLSGRP